MSKRFSCLLAAAVLVLLSACASVREQPAEVQEPAAVQETAEEAVQEVLYHGGEPRTPEAALAQSLADVSMEIPLCPDCGAELSAILTDSQELPAEEQKCLSMIQGTDAVYKLSLTYEWKCPSCGYADSEHTVEGTKAVVCHGWTS